MVDSPTESITADGGDLRAAVRQAVRRLALSSSGRARLILSAAIRPDATLVDALVEALGASPQIVELELVHPSAMAGFVASTLQLRLKQVTIRAVRPTERGSTTAQRVPAPRRGSAVFETPAVASARPVALPAGYQRADIVSALASARGAGHAVLVFEETGRPTRELVAWLADALRAEPTIERLALVHPSPAIGFLTSSLSLQVPTVRVRAARTVEDLGRAS